MHHMWDKWQDCASQPKWSNASHGAHVSLAQSSKRHNPAGSHFLLWSTGCQRKALLQWPSGAVFTSATFETHFYILGNLSFLRKQSKRTPWNPSMHYKYSTWSGREGEIGVRLGVRRKQRPSGCLHKYQIITGMKSPYLDKFHISY